MRIIRCDICGKRIREKTPGANLAGRGNPFSGWFGRVSAELDVCPACMKIGQEMDFQDVIVRAWKEKAREAEKRIIHQPEGAEE